MYQTQALQKPRLLNSFVIENYVKSKFLIFVTPNRLINLVCVTQTQSISYASRPCCDSKVNITQNMQLTCDF